MDQTPIPPPFGQDMSTSLRERLSSLNKGESYPIRLSIDEAEETIRILWEFVGHLGPDVGTQGYEAMLIDRARHWAAQLQSAMLAAIAFAGPDLLAELEAFRHDPAHDPRT